MRREYQQLNTIYCSLGLTEIIVRNKILTLTPFVLLYEYKSLAIKLLVYNQRRRGNALIE